MFSNHKMVGGGLPLATQFRVKRLPLLTHWGSGETTNSGRPEMHINIRSRAGYSDVLVCKADIHTQWTCMHVD